MPKDQRLLYLLTRAGHSLQKRLNADLLQAAGITAPQAGALFHLQRCESCSPTALSLALGLDPSAISGMVRRLEGRELLRRSASNLDRRSATLRLTPEGRQAAERALPVVRAHEAQVRQGFSAEEIDVFRRVLQRIIAGPGEEAHA